MAITPSQWSHVLTIPESYTPPAATSGQTLVINESVIAKLSAGDQTTFWSNVQNGGGDVRICTDSAGTNQLPVEIVSLDNVAETCVIRTRKATYAGNGELYVFIGKAGETKASDTDPFGRNAVWVDDTYRQGGDGLTDVTGNTTISLSGQAALSGTVNGFNSVELNGANSTYAVFDGSETDSFTGDFTVSAWVRANAFNSGALLNILGARTGRDWEFSLRLETNQPAMLIGDSSPNSTASLSTLTNHLLHATVSGSTLSFYLDGTPVGSTTISGLREDRADPLTFGGIESTLGDSTLDGFIAEARMANGSVASASKVATEYANQSDPASFYGTPTIQTTDGGGAVTADVTEVSTDAIESSSISISANITAQITELSDNATESSTVTITNKLVTVDVTELVQNAVESSTADISANISAAVTELAQDFADNANVNLVGSFTVEVTETTTDFDEACYVQLPVQRLTPRKTISVNARRSGRISVNARRSQTIKVR